MKNIPTWILSLSALIFFTACSDTKKDDASQSELSTVLPESKNEVTVRKGGIGAPRRVK